MNANSGADAGHKRRLENRLMVRRRNPYGLRPAWPESSSTGELRGHRCDRDQYRRDAYGRNGDIKILI